MILHHYPTSPFAEKIRLIFGYKHIEWQGVEIPMVMPKPDLMPLTGGYRKTPVLQIGADIYCDTALICDVIEHSVPTPSLYNAAPKGLVRTVAQWADNLLFPVAMAYNFQPQGAQHVMAGMPPEVVKVFAEDRKAMRGGGARMPPADATAMYKSHDAGRTTLFTGRYALFGRLFCVPLCVVYLGQSARDRSHTGRHPLGARLGAPHGCLGTWERTHHQRGASTASSRRC
jgi:glutathione S-transferase